MLLLESLFLLNTFVCLVLQCFSTKATVIKICFGGGGLFLLLHVVLEVARWQLLPAYLLFVMMALLLLKPSTAHWGWRFAGFVVGLSFLGTAGFYASQLPILELPSPSGPHLVGTTSFSVTDAARRDVLSPNPEAQRELFVDVWYPAESSHQTNLPYPQTLWSELYTGEMDRVRFFTDYMRQIDTHSYPNLPVVDSKGSLPIVLFNHGLQMFTSQNTLLMEHLASHGYVVFSIAHPYESLRVNLPTAGTVLPEFITGWAEFNEAMAWIEETSRPILAAIDAIQNMDDRAQRAAIMLETVESMTDLNERVDEWVLDTQFILNHVLTTDATSLALRASLDTSRIAVMGMSLGGAVASEFCKADTRCTAGINVDGLQYGTRQREPLNVPFLMLYSNDAPFVNDFLRLGTTADYHEYWASDARHADFTDLTLAWPLLRTVGQLSTVPGDRMVTILNDVVRTFLHRYVKGQKVAPLSADAYPELRMEVVQRSDSLKH